MTEMSVTKRFVVVLRVIAAVLLLGNYFDNVFPWAVSGDLVYPESLQVPLLLCEAVLIPIVFPWPKSVRGKAVGVVLLATGGVAAKFIL